MIPPLAPGQLNEEQNMVGWKNTFDMRQMTFSNLAATRLTSKRVGSLNYPSAGCITSPAKSLDILRKNLQSAINKDIDDVVKKYLEKFFRPAIGNIRNNLNKTSVTDDVVKGVCRQMLEEAKAMYESGLSPSRDSSPCDYSDSEGGSFADCRIEPMSPLYFKRKESDTDSETGYIVNSKRTRTKGSALMEQFVQKLPEKREGPKWDPDRINQNTLFIMGARANKVLGFGQTRGRLYVRHPDMLRYSGDPEDKEWLASKNLMPPSGGRAYLMLLEDIRELATNEDYRNSPNLQLDELRGFEAPLFMINKIKAFLEQVRTDKKSENRHRPSSDICDFLKSNSIINDEVISSNTLRILDSRISNIANCRRPDLGENNVDVNETSSTSNCTFVSKRSITSESLSVDVPIGINLHSSNSNGDTLLNLVESIHSEKILVNLLSSHGSNENSSQEF